MAENLTFARFVQIPRRAQVVAHDERRQRDAGGRGPLTPNSMTEIKT
jgi:hypothetical protein